jgi:CHAT domain
VEYLDFEVDVSPGQSGGHEVNVRSEFGEATGDFRLPFDALALQNRLQALQLALLRSTSATRGVATPEEETVERFGRELFEALFQDGPILGRFHAARDGAEERDIGLRVKLRIDAPDLAALPWEYLYDPERGDFLGLSIATPLVRYIALPRPIKPFATRPPLRILGLVAATPDLPNLDVDRERQRLEIALKEPIERGQVELHWLPTGTWRDLQAALLEGPWHIFHFIGHGGFDELRGEGFVYIPDESGRATRLSSTGLGRLLGDHDPMRLAILNSCEGARGDAIDVFSSTAATVVQRGTPGVVAMQYQITDRAAIEFSRSFYTAIAGGVPIDAGLAVARKSISLEIPGTLEWGTPVLFMRSHDGVLFEVAPGPPTPESIERRTAPLASARASAPPTEVPPPIVVPPPTLVPPASAVPTGHAEEPAPARKPRAHRAKAAGAAGAVGASASASSPTAPAGAESKPAVSSPDPLARRLSAGGAALGRVFPALGDAFWHGGYFSTLLGAELGAVAAMLGIPALHQAEIPKTIVTFLWPDQADQFKEYLYVQGMWLGVWLGITIGAYLILRLFKVADGHWTTFLLAILAFVMVDQFLKSDLAGIAPNDTSETSVFNMMGGRVVQYVAVIALLARATTRLARNRRL